MATFTESPLLTQSFTQEIYLLRAHHVPGTILGPGETEINKTEENHKLQVLCGKMSIKGDSECVRDTGLLFSKGCLKAFLLWEYVNKDLKEGRE